jgi:hypothetical protein
MSLRVTDKRARLLREVMQLADENTKAGAIDTALAHYIEDHRQKSKIVTDLDPEIADALSTNQLPIELEYEYQVGKGGDE